MVAASFCIRHRIPCHARVSSHSQSRKSRFEREASGSNLRLTPLKRSTFAISLCSVSLFSLLYINFTVSTKFLRYTIMGTETGSTRSTNGNGNHHKFDSSSSSSSKKPSTEYVLNFAFYSFVGFILFQAGFAVIANSESMMADCEAMAVDAMTYLFNLCAERIKNKPFSERELALPADKRALRREEQRLWLELIPPAFSVTCLIVIVIMTLKESIAEFRRTGEGGGDDDDVSVPIMLLFSGANLLLDFVNVACFARSGSTFGLQTVRDEHNEIRSSIRGLREKEQQSLLASVNGGGDDDENHMDPEIVASNGGGNDTKYGSMVSATSSRRKQPSATVVNLNMCSAWTVSGQSCVAREAFDQHNHLTCRNMSF